MKTRKTFKTGDTVKVYYREYIRGTRSPLNPSGRFRYRFAGEGVLLNPQSPEAHADNPTYRGWTAEQFAAHFASHVGLQNATGSRGPDGLTEGNNPVRLTSGRETGRILWCHRDQIR